jgi:hypothetical protein
MKRGNWQPYYVKVDSYNDNIVASSMALLTSQINNDVIEVGDFVNWKNSGTFNKENHEGYEIWKIKGDNFWIIYQNAKEDCQNYPLNIEGLKIIKKANTQTTTINKKPDISSAIQVGNDVTNIVIPKSASVVLKNTENEVKIKINQTKTIKIN